MTGREHWLAAEELLASVADSDPRWGNGITSRAQVHALLALAAPAYAFHQEARPVVADSPNILKGHEEGPNQ